METTPPIFKDAAALPVIQTAADMHQNPAPKRPDVIVGLLKRSSKLAIGGASKARKTWMLMHLGVCAALGQQWLAFDTNPTKVLYVNFELHNDIFEHRLDLICEAMEIGHKNVLGDQFSHWGLRGYAAAYEEILPQISQGIKDHNYGLIILDPMYKILGDADENKAGDITKLMNELERVAFDNNVSVVLRITTAKAIRRTRKLATEFRAQAYFNVTRIVYWNS
jgi:regulatory protein RepA